MRTFFLQLKWQFVILQRNNLITISVVVTAMYALIFFVIKDLGNIDKLLTLLIYNDPAVIGLFFVGLSIIIDKNQQVLSALFVTPVNLHVFLITRVLALSIIGWLCGLGMGFAALGWSFHIFHFSMGVFGTCLMFSLIGVFLVSFTDEFLMFMLKSIPILIVMSFPLFNYFELTDLRIFYLFPAQGCLNLMTNSYADTPVIYELIYGYGSLVVWVLIFYFLAYRIFKSKVVNT